MKETITLPVVCSESEKELKFINEDDVITLQLDDKEICKFDYDGNLEPAMERMLKIWK